MDFLEIEASTHSAKPVELYKITSDGFTTPYFYTSGVKDIIYNGDTYVALEDLSRSQPELSKEVSAQTLSITLPRDNELAKKWLRFVPPRTVWLTVFRYHRPEGAETPEVATFWQGIIRGVTWSVNEASLECMPIDSAFSRNGLRVTSGIPCRHQLYGSKCQVPLGSFIKTATITGISGDVIQSPDFVTVTDGVTPAPDGWWVNGFVENTTTQEIRYVTGHVGTAVTLIVAFETLQVGDTINIAAGCDHKLTTCKNKFNNVVNYGGLGVFLGDNPFTIKLDN